MCDGSCGGRRLSRRTFLAETTMAAVAAALTSACGDGVFGGALGPGQTVALAINVNDFAALTPVGADGDETLDLFTMTAGGGAAVAHIKKIARLICAPRAA